MENTFFPQVYGTFAVLSIGLTIWLARTLARNGEVFLKEVFVDKPDLARAVNQLLVVGFYLINFGYACLQVENDLMGQSSTVSGAIVMLASKLGELLITLAVMHFFNVIVFHRMRRRAELNRMTTPTARPKLQLNTNDIQHA